MVEFQGHYDGISEYPCQGRDACSPGDFCGAWLLVNALALVVSAGKLLSYSPPTNGW